jgi:hypothetical protein
MLATLATLEPIQHVGNFGNNMCLSLTRATTAHPYRRSEGIDRADWDEVCIGQVFLKSGLAFNQLAS